MENTLIAFCLLSIATLTGCSGSDTYLGDWKGTDANGEKYTLSFQPKNFSIKRESGDSLNFEYTQHSVKIKNSIRSYGIKLQDGRIYTILFPIAKDASKAVMAMENGKPVYTLSRNSYLSYEEVYKLDK
jgi:hypothetical protein